MNPSAESRPPLLSCGIEMEFLVQYMIEGGQDHSSEDLPPVTMVPGYIKDRASTMGEYMGNNFIANHIRAMIRQTLRDAGVAVEKGLNPPVDDKYAGFENLPVRRALRFKDWVIKSDSTVTKPSEGAYHYAGMELTTPSLDGTDANLAMVQSVINLLNANYRITVNASCGLHVHVGNGVRGFDLRNMRRMTGFFYAADRTLAMLHPPLRRFSRWVLSIRDRSELACGMTAAQRAKPPDYCVPHCHDFIAVDVRHGEQPVIWRQMNNVKAVTEAFAETRKPGRYEPFQMLRTELPAPYRYNVANESQEARALDGHGADVHRRAAMADTISDEGKYNSSRPRSLPRIAVRTFTPEDDEKFLEAETKKLGYEPAPLADMAEVDLGTYHGLAEIFSAVSTCAIQQLLIASLRPNYNIEPYACEMLEFGEDQAPTLEFREATGSMDARWVVAWAKICCGLATWATHASASEYLRVIAHCDRGQRGEIEYDVVDLLDEVGLIAESQVAEERLRDNVESWGLRFLKE
ncbi:hypothetical protein JX266_007053 [Neoarthrinium moseri]|nr:hypothetical protein JX266_007053 [Neoarthrinium moseri]